MARRIICASWLSLLAVGLGEASAQTSSFGSSAPYAYPGVDAAQRRQAEQLWFGGSSPYTPPPQPGAAATPASPMRPRNLATNPQNPVAPANAQPVDGISAWAPPTATRPPTTSSGPTTFTPGYSPAPAFAPSPAYAPASASTPAYTLAPNASPVNVQEYTPSSPEYTPRLATRDAPPSPGMNPYPPASPTPQFSPYAGPGASSGLGPQAGFAPQPGFTPQPGVGPTAPASPAGPTAHAAARPKGELFEAAQVIGRVGDEPILAGDVLAVVNQFLDVNRDKIPPGREEVYRKRFMRQVLEGDIQTKLVYLDFVRQIQSKGAGPDKIKEILGRVYEQFDEKRLPDLLEKNKVASPAELDAKLREHGSSLAKQKRQFAEKVLAQQWIRECKDVNYNPEVSHGQMLDYYYAHAEDYAIAAKARWEHLMARFDKFPSKAAAYEAIRAMGNEVYLGGAPLWAVAKRSSHGVTASDGGQFESTTQGSLKSKVLDEAIFTLPPNQLSPILEDEEGFHIVRVLERREAGRTSFESAQGEIKEKIKAELVQEQLDAYLKGLREKTPVWTIFDDEKEDEEAERSSFGN